MSRLFEKNVEKLLTYCRLSDIIINCITIACIMVGFLRMKAKNPARSERTAPFPKYCRPWKNTNFTKVKASLN